MNELKQFYNKHMNHYEIPYEDIDDTIQFWINDFLEDNLNKWVMFVTIIDNHKVYIICEYHMINYFLNPNY